MLLRSRSAQRWLVSCLLFGLVAAPGGAVENQSLLQPKPDLTVQVDDPGVWQRVLGCVGLRATTEPARFRIVVGSSPGASAAGAEPTERQVRVAGLIDERDPDLPIFWEIPQELPFYSLRGNPRVFFREKRTRAPLMAGWKEPEGGVLWLATPPGERGYERYPYLIHALTDLGLRLPFAGSRTWAFFDSSYRLRADPAYLARQWRRMGLAAVHAGAWHYQDSDPGRDAFLGELIEACHREGLLVYAWLELPHVSEGFWESHPDCRERTASGQDAQLDWRKLINLANPDCRRKVVAGLQDLLRRFDWDGVNLAELYFESLHGPSNPQRFTPLNNWVREDFRGTSAMDPLDFFRPDSPLFWHSNGEAWEQFSEYRARLALGIQREMLQAVREALPEADLVVTQIDDRFDTRMREFLGADAAALLPLAEQHGFTLLIEDPATLWDLGPGRYPEIARRYLPLTHNPERRSGWPSTSTLSSAISRSTPPGSRLELSFCSLRTSPGRPFLESRSMRSTPSRGLIASCCGLRRRQPRRMRKTAPW
jgi:hypothetical protein